ncbi:MAG: PIG-L family deacetylase [Alphaproteobacteria bacterium]|nr:PIG-L family deacetylase [Alphaproteobacteria bacterium]
MRALVRLLKSAVVAVSQELFAFFSRDVTEKLPQGAVLAIAPHPDDETLGCGAAIARLCAEGRRVRIVVVTDNSVTTGSPIGLPDHLAAIRRGEVKRAAAQMGVSEDNVVLLMHPDGDASSRIEKIADDLGKIIADFKPALILSPYGIDRTADHRAVAAALDIALKDAGFNGVVYEYPVWFWPFGALRHMMALSPLAAHRKIRAGEYLAKKRAAFAEHRSRVENLTGNEKLWMPLDREFITRFMKPYELFFEKKVKISSGEKE